MAANESPELDRESRTAAYIGVGCFTMVAGFASGGMIAVLIAKIVGAIQGCPVGENNQPCNWGAYALVGMVVGAITLPILALSRMRKPKHPAARNSQ